MPKDVSTFYARSRPYHDPDLGTMVVREPTMGDYRRAASDPWWWVACLSMVDGTPLLADPADMGRIRADIANRLWDVVQQPHPTEPPPGGSSESQAPSSAT